MVFKLEKNKEVLDLESRNKIYHLVSKNAGSHLRELERKSRISYSTLKYHLHYLTRKGLIVEKKGEGNSRFFIKEVSTEDIETLSMLRQKNMRKILIYLAANKKTKLAELEQFTKLSASTISWYLNRLIKKRVVEKTADRRNVTFELSSDREEIKRILISYRESFLDNLVDKVVEMWEVG